MSSVEADAYFCLCKLLEGIQVRSPPCAAWSHAGTSPGSLKATQPGWLVRRDSLLRLGTVCAGSAVRLQAWTPAWRALHAGLMEPPLTPAPHSKPRTQTADAAQDHYTYAQPGIQRTVFSIKELVRRIDVPFAQHLEAEGLEFLQFAFRWRPHRTYLVRLWDGTHKLQWQTEPVPLASSRWPPPARHCTRRLDLDAAAQRTPACTR